MSILVDPIVLFNILDHYPRRLDGQDFVLGALLGTRMGDRVEIKNSIPVPHAEDNDNVTVVIDLKFLQTMRDLYSKVDSKNVLVGWYCTCYTEHTAATHEFYTKLCQHPIHMTVDPTVKGGSLNIKTLVCQPLQLSNEITIGPILREVPFKWQSHSAARVALDEMFAVCKAPKEEEGIDGEEDAALAENPVEEIKSMLGKLLTQLTKVSDYVNKVVSGEVTEDKTIGRQLMSIISRPVVQPEQFERVFNNSLQDMLMVLYLAKLVRTQLVLTDKIYTEIAPSGAFPN